VRTQSTVDFGQPGSVRFTEPFSPSELDGAVPILQVAFRDGMEFIDALAEGRGPAGELAVQTRARPPRGLQLVAEIRWPRLPNRVYLRVESRDRLEDGRLLLRLDAAEARKREFLVSVACGTSENLSKRRHRRYCVRLPLEWRRFGTRVMHNGIAEDLSAGGIQIASASNDVVKGDEVVIKIDGNVELVLTGTVQHVERRPATGELSLGVRFEYRDSGQARTLRRVLRTCSARGVTLVDPG